MSTFHSAQIVWICKYVSSKFVLVSIPRLNSIKIKITPSDRFVGCQNNCIVVVNIFVLMFTLANFLTCSEGLLQFLLTKTRLTKPIIDNFPKKKKKNSKSDFNFQYYYFFQFWKIKIQTFIQRTEIFSDNRWHRQSK